MTQPAEAGWKNRIVSYGVKPASQFTPHPNNPKFHPQFQRDALRGALDTVGWVGVCVESLHTGYLLDGHERIWNALAMGDETPVPYIVVDVTEDEELFILATLDPIGMLAQHDAEITADLLQQVNSDNPALQTLLASLADSVGLYPDDAPAVDDGEPDDVPTVWEVPDAIFPSDNTWGVPTLDVNLQGEYFELPVTKWGTVSRAGVMRGTYYFYTEDYKFAALWQDPAPVVNSGCKVAVEPNFSTNNQLPRALVVADVYRKRWIARWWQRYGVRVFVDMNVERMFFDLNFLGVPKEWRAYANRAYVGDLDHLDEAYDAACTHHGSKDIVYAVIGGRDSVESKCRANGWLWIPEASAVVKRTKGL